MYLGCDCGRSCSRETNQPRPTRTSGLPGILHCSLNKKMSKEWKILKSVQVATIWSHLTPCTLDHHAWHSLQRHTRHPGQNQVNRGMGHCFWEAKQQNTMCDMPESSLGYLMTYCGSDRSGPVGTV